MNALASYSHLSPGARVIIRDEEWLVRKIDRSSSGAAVLSVVGLSPLVEGKEARFVDSIENEASGISVVDPRLTRAVADTSPFFRASRLAIESHLRASTPESLAIHLGHHGARVEMEFQIYNHHYRIEFIQMKANLLQ